MQNPHPSRVSKFLSGVGLIIVGALFWSQTAVLAESYVRVVKQGVVYYNFPGREHSPPQPAVLPPPPQQWAPPSRQIRVITPETDQAQDLWPRLIKAVHRLETCAQPAPSAQSTPDLTHIALGHHDLEGAAFYPNIWLAPRCLGRLWAKIGSLARLTRAVDQPDHQLPPSPEAQALVREACQHFLRYAQEQSAASGQRQRISNHFPGANQFGYCFPVAQPFSFRDSWGEARRGGRQHHAVDIFAQEGTRVYAVTTGVIHTLATFPEAGLTLILSGQDGKGYGYMHLQGYAPGIVEGKEVKAGELIAYVGRTGLQQSEAHLHFQVYADQRLCKDELLNPYNFLVQLCQGIGVTDLYLPKVARLNLNQEMQAKEMPVKAIRVSKRSALRVRASQIKVKEPTILVINNF